MATKMKEKEIDGKMTLVVSGNEILDRIKATCDKVEKAQDSYKSIMEDVYLVHKYKLHKEAGMTFADFMEERTGMSRQTAHRLVAVWKSHLKIGKICSEAEFPQEVVDFILKWHNDLPMRKLLTITQHKLESDIVKILDNEQVTIESCDAAYEDAERDYIPAERETKKIEEKPKEVSDTVAGGSEETAHYTTVEILSEADLDELVEVLTGIYEAGSNILVKYATM